MSNNNENKLVPKLRFPELKNEEEWEVKAISELGYTVNGLTGKKAKDFGTGKPYVQYKQVFDKSFIDFSECGKVSIGDNENQNELHKGDILFTTSSETPNEVGFASVLIEEPNEPTYLNSFCFILRPFNLDELKPNFSRHLFRSPIYRKLVNAIAQGAIRYNLSKGAFLDLKLTIPKPQEQQKIAACLSSLDEVIAAESRKLELLKEHKKGLLQNLFPQEGETVPKLRFPEFKDDGEWEETTLGEIGEPLMCRRIFKEETTPDPNNGVPFYKIGTFGRFADSYISKEIFEEYKSKYSFPKIGDILISASGTIGRLVIYDGSPAYFQDSNIIWLGHNENVVLNSFLFYCYSNLRWQTSDGGVISRLYNSDFKRMIICFPKNHKEQQKIAETLSSIDDLFNAQSQKIEALKLYKKGLLQGLFPEIK
jgi:type I restriction enzyme S subunit